MSDGLDSYWCVRFSSNGGVRINRVRCIQDYVTAKTTTRMLFVKADGLTIAEAMKWAAGKVPDGSGVCPHCGGKT